MPSVRLAAAGDVAWDSASIVNGGTLSDGNRLFTGRGTGALGHVRATAALSGNVYFSGVASGSGSDECAFGVAVDLLTADQYLGEFDTNAGAWSDDAVYFNNANAGAFSGGAVEIAVNVDKRWVWFREASGPWIGGGDPESGLAPTCTLSGTGPIFAAGCTADPGSSVRLHAAAADVTGTPPSGFTRGF